MEKDRFVYFKRTCQRGAERLCTTKHAAEPPCTRKIDLSKIKYGKNGSEEMKERERKEKRRKKKEERRRKKKKRKEERRKKKEESLRKIETKKV